MGSKEAKCKMATKTLKSADLIELVKEFEQILKRQGDEVKYVSEDDIDKLKVCSLLLKKKELKDLGENGNIIREDWKELKYILLDNILDDLEVNRIITDSRESRRLGFIQLEIIDNNLFRNYIYKLIEEVLDKLPSKRKKICSVFRTLSENRWFFTICTAVIAGIILLFISPILSGTPPTTQQTNTINSDKIQNSTVFQQNIIDSNLSILINRDTNTATIKSEEKKAKVSVDSSHNLITLAYGNQPEECTLWFRLYNDGEKATNVRYMLFESDKRGDLNIRSCDTENPITFGTFLKPMSATDFCVNIMPPQKQNLAEKIKAIIRTSDGIFETDNIFSIRWYYAEALPNGIFCLKIMVQCEPWQDCIENELNKYMEITK